MGKILIMIGVFIAVIAGLALLAEILSKIEENRRK